MTWTRIAITVAVLAAPAPARADGTFELGAGFSTDEGFLASAKVEQDDLFHTGQLLSLSSFISARRQEFLLDYEVPDLAGSGLDLRAELASRRHVYTHYARDGVGGSLQLSRDVASHTRVYLRYRVEEIEVERLTRSSSDRPLGDGVVSALGAGIVYDTIGDKPGPSHGTRLELYGEHADPRLGSTYDYVRITASLDHARPLGPFTLRLHGSAAAVRSRDPMGVPLAFRLQHEGHADVRGYPLGAGGAAGANLEALGRIELELPVFRKLGLSVAGFAEAGLRFNTDAAWGARNALLQRAVGASLIWRSPIGPLRFDWALPQGGERRGAQFLFGFGAP